MSVRSRRCYRRRFRHGAACAEVRVGDKETRYLLVTTEQRLRAGIQAG
jgi:hypothetical protein